MEIKTAKQLANERYRQKNKEYYNEYYRNYYKTHKKTNYAKVYKERLENGINYIDLTIELIKQQPTNDDSWILDRLNGIKYCLIGGEKNENDD